MTLWPEEYEGLREEVRLMAEEIVGRYTPVEQVSTGRDEQIAQRRQMLAAMEVTSPDGTDEILAGVPCRVFRPAGRSRGTYVNLHGGAMIYGHPRMDDLGNACQSKCLGVTVVSPDYRLAPEHPFPAGPDDCLAVTEEVIRTEPGRIVLGGGSSGAYYAALTLLRARDELGAVDRISAANLVSGVYDLSGTPSALGIRPSGVADLLGPAAGELVHDCYLPGRSRLDLRDPAYSPLYGQLHNLPPALFTVGSADHLLDDTLFMARRYESYGNITELGVYPDGFHGFNSLPSELAKRANERIDAFLERAFAGKL